MSLVIHLCGARTQTQQHSVFDTIATILVKRTTNASPTSNLPGQSNVQFHIQLGSVPIVTLHYGTDGGTSVSSRNGSQLTPRQSEDPILNCNLAIPPVILIRNSKRRQVTAQDLPPLLLEVGLGSQDTPWNFPMPFSVSDQARYAYKYPFIEKHAHCQASCIGAVCGFLVSLGTLDHRRLTIHTYTQMAYL